MQNDDIIIPQKVFRDKRLSSSAKLLYGELVKLCGDFGRCYLSNYYLPENFDVQKPAVDKWLKMLSDCEYIKYRKLYLGTIRDRQPAKEIIILNKKNKYLEEI